MQTDVYLHTNGLSSPELFSTNRIQCMSKRETGNAYKSGVYIPSETWAKKAQQAVVRTTADKGNTIHYFKLPENRFSELYQLVVGQFDRIFRSRFEPDQTNELNEELLAIIQPFLPEIMPGFHRLAKGVVVPSWSFLTETGIVAKSSITPDTTSPFRLRGLHVDNWEMPRKSLDRRSESAYKLLLNVGSEPRYFAYVPYTVETLFSYATATCSSLEQQLIFKDSFATSLVEWYMENHPQTEVNLIEIPPGFGVIAPVQNIIHDGYPGAKKEMDICFHSQVYLT